MRPRALKRKQIRDHLFSTRIFQAWKPEKAMACIKGSILSITREDEAQILHKEFIGKRQTLNWSYGYCHCIAQVAAIVFRSQRKKVAVWKADKDKKMLLKIKVPRKHQGHFVLRLWDGSFFDPQAEPKMGFTQKYYEDKGYTEYRLVSQWWFPSNRARHLFRVFVNHCCQKSVFTKQQQAKAAILLTKLDIR